MDEIALEKIGVAKIAKVNVDENQELATRFKVQSIPLLLFFKDGQVVDQQRGADTKKALISKLDALL